MQSDVRKSRQRSDERFERRQKRLVKKRSKELRPRRKDFLRGETLRAPLEYSRLIQVGDPQKPRNPTHSKSHDEKSSRNETN